MKKSTIVERVTGLVSEAEQGVRTLISEAAVEGHYDLVRKLSGIAENLATMGSHFRGSPSVSGDSTPAASSRSKATTRQPKRSTAKAGYPRFEVSGNTLLRIGWSKKTRSEYEHRVPQNSFKVVVESLTRIAEASDGPIVPQELIEQCGLPGYQVYAVLGFLAERMILERRGREGYFVATPNIAGSADGAWIKAQETRA